ncbi:tRNA (adenosine(37)-N6)-threonylcarbamoyltransferase complex ATPase subunit type 1 TsaE [Candidatus Margulisiibacteriota bacterium]
MNLVINNLGELESLANSFALLLKKKHMVLLSGDLGAGKTTFVYYLAKALGVKENVCSPTFTIINRYTVSGNGSFEKSPAAKSDKKTIPFKYIYHIDLYRLNSSQEIYDIDLENYFSKDEAVFFIEWPEKMGIITPKEYLKLSFCFGDSDKDRKKDYNKRVITLKALGRRHQVLLENVSKQINI